MITFPLEVELISDSSAFAIKLAHDQRWKLNSVTDLKSFNYNEFIAKETSKYVIIDIQDANKEAAIFAGLLLRNAGRQVFLTLLSDYDDFLQLVLDVSDQLQKKPDLITEILITENATDRLGDVRHIVRRFELEFSGK